MGIALPRDRSERKRMDPALARHLHQESQRTRPDYTVYVPGSLDGSTRDTGNEHFLVSPHPQGGLFAVWTQSSYEGQPDQRVVRPGLEAAGERFPPHGGEGGRVGVERGMDRIVGEAAGAEQVEAGDGQSFGAGQFDAARVPVAPAVTGPRVQQDAGHREVEADAGGLVRVGGAQPGGQRLPAVHPLHHEVPPAAVVGDVQVRVGLPRHRGDQGGGVAKPLRAKLEMHEVAAFGLRQYGVGALPHRVGGQQPSRIVVGGGAQSVSPRPLATVSSSAVGTAGVK